MALAPVGQREWLGEAVEAGGGVLTPPEDAEALVWASTGNAAELAALLHDDLRWVQLPWAGIEPFLEVLDDRRTWTCAKGVYAEPVAEHALALALAGLRRVGAYARLPWWGEPLGENLLGAPVTIVGGGGITRSLVRLLFPFKCEVTVVRRHPKTMKGVARVMGPGELREALVEARVVFLALPLVPDTVGLIGAVELDGMHPDAWLVNVGRGRHVVTADLVGALRFGIIGGAALDVTDPEPLPEGHPLWSLANCIVTPHVGNTPDMARPLLERRITENVRRFAEDEKLLGRVNPALGY